MCLCAGQPFRQGEVIYLVSSVCPHGTMVSALYCTEQTQRGENMTDLTHRGSDSTPASTLSTQPLDCSHLPVCLSTCDVYIPDGDSQLNRLCRVWLNCHLWHYAIHSCTVVEHPNGSGWCQRVWAPLIGLLLLSKHLGGVCHRLQCYCFLCCPIRSLSGESVIPKMVVPDKIDVPVDAVAVLSRTAN